MRDNQIADQFMGVRVEGDDNTLQGNDVGTKVSGKRALPNGFGVRVIGGDDNLIGGTPRMRATSCRATSPASGSRPGDDAATSNDVQGNLIGTTFTGRAPLPNGARAAIPASRSSRTPTRSAATADGAGNVISVQRG